MTVSMAFSPETAAVLQSLEAAIASDMDRARTEAARELIAALNNAVRRLRQAESREEWVRTLADAARPFCERAEFVSVGARTLTVAGIEVPLANAPAVATAVASKDTVVAAATAGELSSELLSAIGDAARVVLAPVLVGDKVAGVVCAVPKEGDVSAVELLASLAAASVVTAPETTTESKPAELIRIAGVPASTVQPQTRRAWDELSQSEQAVHLKAQRLARTLAAEMVLHKPEAVRRGRASSDLYSALREEIDESRHIFRRQYFDSCPSMVDYLHLELVRTLAKDDSRALGPDYPGPLP
jgi:hypothetical protein